jgi:hypothetical protein
LDSGLEIEDAFRKALLVDPLVLVTFIILEDEFLELDFDLV